MNERGTIVFENHWAGKHLGNVDADYPEEVRTSG